MVSGEDAIWQPEAKDPSFGAQDHVLAAAADELLHCTQDHWSSKPLDVAHSDVALNVVLASA